MYSIDTQQRLAEIRLKAREGTATDDEIREAISLLREGRMAAQAASTKKRTPKAVKEQQDAASLLAELDNFKLE